MSGPGLMLVQGRSGRYGQRWHKYLGGRRPVADRGMRADGVVVTPPPLDDDLRLAKGVEDLALGKSVPEPGMETMDVTVLPRAARSDIGRLGSDRRDPLLNGLGDELRAVVRADVARHATQDEQVREHVDHVDGLELASDPDGQALVGELVDDVEHAEPPSVVRPVLGEVVGPDVVAMLGPQPDARSVREPEPSAFGLL